MGARRTKVTVHGVPVDITEDRMEAFFAQFGKAEEVSGVISKAGIAIGDIVLQITLTHRRFANILNILMYREMRILVVVEGRRPYCWLCGVSGHMAKACPGSNVTSKTRSRTTATVETDSVKAPGGG